MTLIAEKTLIQILLSAVKCGVTDFCICPGARNFPFIQILKKQKQLRTYYFYDERSAGFFALGKSRATNTPVAVITTSGTAVAHLLAPAMEGYYTGVPLLFITADRPRSHRGCNTPQSCEQINIYGIYTPFKLDLEEGDPCDLLLWDLRAPAHVNICIEESVLVEKLNDVYFDIIESSTLNNQNSVTSFDIISHSLNSFFSNATKPLVVVGFIKSNAKSAVMNFLKQLKVPMYLEGSSGLREEPCLQEMHVTSSENIWEVSQQTGYQINGILRIGGVPTLRLWRDLENKMGEIEVLSINEVPFSGLKCGRICCTSLRHFFSNYQLPNLPHSLPKKWLKKDLEYQHKLSLLFEEEAFAEPSLIHRLSQKISENSMIYLGNSLPLREWDLAATFKKTHSNIHVNRGVNGIDGQTSTFLGLVRSEIENWAILGDLTALHDLSAPWIIPQLESKLIQIVIVNNGGGKIFARMFDDIEVQNNHTLEFCSFASLWNIDFIKWKDIPSDITYEKPRIIELVPDNQSTERFWKKLAEI